MATGSIVILSEHDTATPRIVDELGARGIVHTSHQGGGSEGDASAALFIRHGMEIADATDRLFGYLQGRRFDILYLLALRRGSTPDHAVNFEDQIWQVLDQNCKQYKIELVTGVIAVPTDQHPSFRKAEFHEGWDFRMVVEPLNSYGQQGYMPIPLSEDAADWVPSLVTGLIAGLFTFLESAPRPSWPPWTGQCEIHVTRVHARMIDAGDLVGRVLDIAMDPSDQWPLPPDTLAHRQPEQAMSQLAAQAAEALEFTFTPLAEPAAMGPTQMRPWPAIKLFLSRFWTYLESSLRGYVDDQLERVKHAIETAIQNRTFGEDSMILVTLTERPPTPETIRSGDERVDLLARTCNLDLSAPVPNADPWVALTTVAYGLVDGGDFAGAMAGHELVQEQLRAVVDNRDLICPSPFDDEVQDYQATLELSGDDMLLLGLGDQPLTLRPCDAHGARTVLQTAAARGTSFAVGDPIDYEPEVIPEEIPEEETGGDHAAGTVVGGPDAPDDVGPDDEHPAQLGASLPDLQLRVERWIGDRGTSCLWQLADRLSRETENALDDFASAEDRWQKLTAELEEAVEEEQRVRRKIRWIGVVLVAILGFLVAGIVGAIVAAATALLVVVVVGLFLWSIATAGLLLRNARELVQAEFRLDRAKGAPERVMNRRLHAASEYARLSYLIDQLNDHATTIGVFVHRPLGVGSSEGRIDPWHEPVPLNNFGIGAPRLDEHAVGALALRLRRLFTQRDWLNKIALEYLDRWIDDYERLSGLEGNDADPSCDASTADRPIAVPGTDELLRSPRRQLREDTLRGSGFDELRAHRIDELRDDVTVDDVVPLIQDVTTGGDDLDGSSPTDFLEGILDSTAPSFDRSYLSPEAPLGEQLHVVAQSLGGAPSGFGTKADGTNRLSGTPTKVPRERFLLASYRIDISETMEPYKTSLIEEIEDEEEEHPPIKPDDEPFG